MLPEERQPASKRVTFRREFFQASKGQSPFEIPRNKIKEKENFKDQILRDFLTEGRGARWAGIL